MPGSLTFSATVDRRALRRAVAESAAILIEQRVAEIAGISNISAQVAVASRRTLNINFGDDPLEVILPRSTPLERSISAALLSRIGNRTAFNYQTCTDANVGPYADPAVGTAAQNFFNRRYSEESARTLLQYAQLFCPVKTGRLRASLRAYEVGGCGEPDIFSRVHYFEIVKSRNPFVSLAQRYLRVEQTQRIEGDVLAETEDVYAPIEIAYVVN